MKGLNVLVCGAGAVGIFFGGKLLQAGFNVVFTDTPERNKLLKDSRLYIRSAIDEDSGTENDHSFKPQIAENISELPAQDIILVCVKAFQTYEVAINLLPVVQPSTITLSLQNGLENEKILSDFLGKNLVMGAALSFNGTMENQTSVAQKAPARIIFGEMDGQPSEREERLSSIFSRADISHKIAGNIVLEIWKKFIWNNAFSSISAIANTTIRQTLDCRRILPTIRQMMLETRQIARAEGVEISDRTIDELLSATRDYTDVKSNMLRDIEAGKMPEVESFVGIVLEKAEKLGISTPVNETVYALSQLLISTRALKKDSPTPL